MNQSLRDLAKSFNSSNQFFWFLLIILAGLVSMLPVGIFGVPSGNDAHQHFQFAQIFYDSISSGNLFPNWSAFENHGFGGIGTRFYPPLGYYSLAIARILVGNWYDATWLTFTMWAIIGSFGTYLWAREFFPLQISGLAAIFYALSPFNLTQIYQCFIYAEFVACAILPFCFLFVTRVIRRGKPIDILGLGVFYALLILSHIPLTLIGSISLGIYALAILDWQKFVKTSINLTIGLSLGLFASSFHWIRIALEMNWLNHSDPRYLNNLYNYQEYFFPFYIDFKTNFWATYMWLLDITTLIAAISVLLPLIILAVKRSQSSQYLKVFLGGTITGAFAFFMTTSASSIIWQMFPILQKVQFPWRWFSIVFMVGSISFAGFIVPIVQAHLTKRYMAHLVLLFFFGLLFFNYTQIIISSAPVNRAPFEESVSTLLTDESFDCWWTIWAKKEAFENPEKVSVASREVIINRWDREQRDFEVSAGEAKEARIATFYYPYWQAKINGETVQTKLNDDGTILIPLPKENSKVSLFFDEPNSIKIAKIVSLLIWGFLVLFGIIFLAKRFQNLSKLILSQTSLKSTT